MGRTAERSPSSSSSCLAGPFLKSRLTIERASGLRLPEGPSVIRRHWRLVRSGRYGAIARETHRKGPAVLIGAALREWPSAPLPSSLRLMRQSRNSPSLFHCTAVQEFRGSDQNSGRVVARSPSAPGGPTMQTDRAVAGPARPERADTSATPRSGEGCSPGVRAGATITQHPNRRDSAETP